ncbi:MAG: cytochrome b [Paracoccaceae bacterium]
MTAGWGRTARALHWIMAAVILFMLALGVWMTRFVPDLGTRYALTQLHKSWGFVVFCLALVRIGWRLAVPAPQEVPMPRWQRRAARLSHLGLYALMLILPLSGWVMVSASPTQDLMGIQNMVFGLFPMPDPWVPGVGWIERMARTVHGTAVWALSGLLVLHVGAALHHHLIARDRVLMRMVAGK